MSIHVGIGMNLSQICHYRHPKLFKVQSMYFGFNFWQWSEFWPSLEMSPNLVCFFQFLRWILSKFGPFLEMCPHLVCFFSNSLKFSIFKVNWVRIWTNWSEFSQKVRIFQFLRLIKKFGLFEKIQTKFGLISKNGPNSDQIHNKHRKNKTFWENSDKFQTQSHEWSKFGP